MKESRAESRGKKTGEAIDDDLKRAIRTGLEMRREKWVKSQDPHLKFIQ
jgi:uncharacterized protein YllA (UPF0747 family)